MFHFSLDCENFQYGKSVTKVHKDMLNPKDLYGDFSVNTFF